jgi:hypothetical protein
MTYFHSRKQDVESSSARSPTNAKNEMPQDLESIIQSSSTLRNDAGSVGSYAAGHASGWFWVSVLIGAVVLCGVAVVIAWKPSATPSTVVVFDNLPSGAVVFVDGVELALQQSAGRGSGTVAIGTRRIAVRSEGRSFEGPKEVHVVAGQQHVVALRFASRTRERPASSHSNEPPRTAKRGSTSKPPPKIASVVAPSTPPKQPATPAPAPASIISPRSSKWVVVGDELHLRNIIRAHCSISWGDDDWGDIDLDFDAKNTEADGRGYFVQVHCDDRLSFWRLDYGVDGGNNARLIEYEKGMWREGWVDRSFPPLSKDEWRRFHVVLRGSHARIAVDGVDLIERDFPKPLKGKVALGTFRSTAAFRNIKVTDAEGRVLWEGLPPLPPASDSEKPASNKSRRHEPERDGSP